MKNKFKFKKSNAERYEIYPGLNGGYTLRLSTLEVFVFNSLEEMFVAIKDMIET